MLLDARLNRSWIYIIYCDWDKAADMFLAACFAKSWFGCAKGHTHRLSVSTAATCHYRRSANTQPKNTTAQLTWLQRLKICGPDVDLHQRSDPLSSVICRAKLQKHQCRLHVPGSSRFTAVSVCAASNGFCTDASRKPVLEEKCSKQDSREKEEVQGQGASPPPAREGHFQFKELVSRVRFEFLHSYFHTWFLTCLSSE